MSSFHFTLSLLFIGASVLPGAVRAHDLTVNLAGSIQNNTCSVAADSVNKPVSMGNVDSRLFIHSGDAASPVRFTLNLENCGDATSGVAVELNGAVDPNNMKLLGLDKGEGNAVGVGIAILDDDSKLIPINSTSKIYPMPTSINGNPPTSMSMVFYAEYMANGSTVQAGNANASATFTLAYP